MVSGFFSCFPNCCSPRNDGRLSFGMLRFFSLRILAFSSLWLSFLSVICLLSELTPSLPVFFFEAASLQLYYHPSPSRGKFSSHFLFLGTILCSCFSLNGDMMSLFMTFSKCCLEIACMKSVPECQQKCRFPPQFCLVRIVRTELPFHGIFTHPLSFLGW